MGTAYEIVPFYLRYLSRRPSGMRPITTWYCTHYPWQWRSKPRKVNSLAYVLQIKIVHKSGQRRSKSLLSYIFDQIDHVQCQFSFCSTVMNHSDRINFVVFPCWPWPGSTLIKTTCLRGNSGLVNAFNPLFFSYLSVTSEGGPKKTGIALWWA